MPGSLYLISAPAAVLTGHGCLSRLTGRLSASSLTGPNASAKTIFIAGTRNILTSSSIPLPSADHPDRRSCI
jgi:hypothetical protein